MQSYPQRISGISSQGDRIPDSPVGDKSALELVFRYVLYSLNEKSERTSYVRTIGSWHRVGKLAEMKLRIERRANVYAHHHR